MILQRSKAFSIAQSTAAGRAFVIRRLVLLLLPPALGTDLPPCEASSFFSGLPAAASVRADSTAPVRNKATVVSEVAAVPTGPEGHARGSPSDSASRSEALSESTRSSAASHTGRDAGGAPGMPLEFHSEVVRLFVEPDTVTVEGLYRFLCDSSYAEFMSLFYPYPEDSLMGNARTVVADCRAPGASRRPVDFVELPDNRGARWMLPLTLGDTLEVRVVYRQALLDSYVRYILTTTGGWPRPLKHARFEIFLPEGAEPEGFSLPFKRTVSEGRDCYLYEAEDFRSDRDIICRWKIGAAECHRE